MVVVATVVVGGFDEARGVKLVVITVIALVISSICSTLFSLQFSPLQQACRQFLNKKHFFKSNITWKHACKICDNGLHVLLCRYQSASLTIAQVPISPNTI